MKKKLSERQKKVLAFLESYITENGRPPTVREIGDGVEVTSTSLVSYYLNALEAQELITRESGISRGIRLTHDAGQASSEMRDFFVGDGETMSIPFLGYIVASAPIQTEALSGSETIEINRALFGKDSADLFALTVQGDSMIDALVNDGDTIILRHQQRVENGEMAAVWLLSDAATTLKKVYYEGARVRLQPANPTMQAFYVPADDMQVQGKVVMVIRRLE